MDSYEETFETWNKVAKLYQDQFSGLNLYDDTYDFFCEQLVKDNSAILEIGCGPGIITKYLLNKRPGFKIEAIDISPAMIELAKMNNPKANFKVMDCRKMDRLETKFDAVIGGFCLPYLSESDCSKFMKDSKTLLADNGIIYLSFVEGDYKNSGYQTASSGDRVYFYYHRSESITNKLNENGFRTIKRAHKQYTRNGGVEEHHTILLAKRINEPCDKD